MSGVSLRDIISKTMSEWMKGTGPESDIVIGSRVRLARNLSGIPFPAVASDESLRRVVELVERATKQLESADRYEFVRLSEVPILERQLLIEKHLISPQHAEQVKHKAVVLRDDEAVSIMVNEEDHLRIQALFPGMQPHEAWALCSKVDDAYDAHLPYAFNEERGYLTACPTNVGTGMRASLMVHLPALAMTRQIPRVLQIVSQFGLAVRGLYGEGTEAQGNIFQFSNQVTLGRTEEEILQNLVDVTRQIIEQERQARVRHEQKPRALRRPGLALVRHPEQRTQHDVAGGYATPFRRAPRNRLRTCGRSGRTDIAGTVGYHSTGTLAAHYGTRTGSPRTGRLPGQPDPGTSEGVRR